MDRAAGPTRRSLRASDIARAVDEALQGVEVRYQGGLLLYLHDDFCKKGRAQTLEYMAERLGERARLAVSAAAGERVALGDSTAIFYYSFDPDPSTASPAVPAGADKRRLYVFREFQGPGPGAVPEPWVVVDESAALARRGLSGRGVYAWWEWFAEGDTVGVYVGEVLGGEDRAGVSAYVRSLPPHQPPADAFVNIRGHVVSGRQDPFTRGDLRARCDDGGLLFDPRRVGWPGMFAHLINDAHLVPGCSCNVRVTEPDGVVQALRSVPPFVVGLSAGENVESELLRDYGEGFWRLAPQAAG